MSNDAPIETLGSTPIAPEGVSEDVPEDTTEDDPSDDMVTGPVTGDDPQDPSHYEPAPTPPGNPWDEPVGPMG